MRIKAEIKKNKLKVFGGLGAKIKEEKKKR
jgi:hypothetical protein